MHTFKPISVMNNGQSIVPMSGPRLDKPNINQVWATWGMPAVPITMLKSSALSLPQMGYFLQEGSAETMALVSLSGNLGSFVSRQNTRPSADSIGTQHFCSNPFLHFGLIQFAAIDVKHSRQGLTVR